MAIYPVRQPNGNLAIWSMVVEQFTAFDLTIAAAAASIKERHSSQMDDIRAFCTNVQKGKIPYPWMMTWDEALAKALHQYGKDDEEVKKALDLTPDPTKAFEIAAEMQRQIESEEEKERLKIWGLKEIIAHQERKDYYFADLSRVPGTIVNLLDVMYQEQQARMTRDGITAEQYDRAIGLAMEAMRAWHAEQELTFSPECQLTTPKEPK